MDNNFKFECLEEYFGDKEQVLKKIDECKSCNSKLVFIHHPDYKNFVVHETAKCLNCGQGNRKVIHVIH